MSAPGSGPYERSEASGGDATGRPPRSQAPLVQLPSVPLVQDEAGGRTPRLQLGHVADRIADRLGLDPATLEGRCPLPGHEGPARLVSGIPEDEQGDLRLACCQGRWRSLGEVRAAIAYVIDNGGLPRRKGGRSNVELATWTRRLAYEVGAFKPEPVAAPPLPSGASPATRCALEGFLLLVGLRWADGPRVAVPFAVRFAAAWCGLGHGTAQHAISTLIKSGAIYEAGRHGRMPLYLPGPVPEEAEPEPDPADEDALVARIMEAFDAEELPLDSSDDEVARP
jgi:hypothetical protein